MSTDPTCPTCSRPIRPGRTYCSAACYPPRTEKYEPAVCGECGATFTRLKKRHAIYCSNPCRIKGTARQNKGHTQKKLHQHTVGRGTRTPFEPL